MGVSLYISLLLHILLVVADSSAKGHRSFVLKDVPNSPTSATPHNSSLPSVLRQRTIIPQAAENIYNCKTWDSHNQPWKRSYNRGKRKWELLQEALKNLAPDNAPADLAKWDRTTIKAFQFEEFFWQLLLPGAMLPLLDGLEKAPLGSSDVCAGDTYVFRALRTQEGLPTAYKKTNLHMRIFNYENWFSARARCIIAFYNEGRIARASPASTLSTTPTPGVVNTQTPSTITNILYSAPVRWADAIFVLWKQACAEERRSPSVLKFIVRALISNPETINTLDEIQRNIPMSTHFLFESSQDDFFAILGTPNGVGTADLLTRYVHSFGTKSTSDGRYEKVKTVGRAIFIDTGSSTKYDLGFILDDVNPSTL